MIERHEVVERHWVVNGEPIAVAFRPDLRLLDVLREELKLTGTKQGCGEGECGACSVLLDDRLVLACLTLAAALPDGTSILTVEGLERVDLGRALQAAFVGANAVQCGFCTPGMILAAYAVVAKTPDPTAEQVKTALSGNLCRCTGYQMIVEAVLGCARTGDPGRQA